jgi:flagellin
MNQALAELSSGKQINSAADNPSGLTISEQMQGQINGLSQANSNTQNGISLIQTAEGGLNETQSILQTMRELAVQASNGTNTTTDLQAIQDQISQYSAQIDNIANTTQFNTINLLTGNLGLSTTDGQNIQQLAMTSNTQAGTMNFTGATATLAKAASQTLATAAGITTVQTSNSLTVSTDGKTYNIGTTAGQTYDDLANQISAITGLNVTFTAGTTAADKGAFTFTTPNANADQSIDVNEATANDLDGASSFTGIAATKGTNASLTAGTATGSDGAAITFSFYGNQATVTNGSQEGLSLTLAPDTGSTTTATLGNSTITAGSGMSFQIGANQGQTMAISINAMDSSNLGIGGINVTTQDGAENAITSIDNAISSVSAQNSQLGADQDRLQDTSDTLTTANQDLTSANATLTDVDMASEMSTYTQDSILVQSATSMLAQAQQEPQNVLKLLQSI